MLPSKGEKESKQRKRFPSCESVSGVDPPKKSGPVIERKLVAHFLAIFLRLDFWDSKVKAQEQKTHRLPEQQQERQTLAAATTTPAARRHQQEQEEEALGLFRLPAP